MRLPFKWLLATLLLVSFNLNSQSLNWGRSLGNAKVLSTAQFSNGDILLAGQFEDSLKLDQNYPVFTAPNNKVHGFIARLDTNGAVIWCHALAGEKVKVNSVSLGLNDTIFIGGNFTANVALDPGTPSTSLNTADPLKNEPFVAKYSSNGIFITGGSFRYPDNLLNFDVDMRIAANNLNNTVIIAIPVFDTVKIDLEPGPASLWINPPSNILSFIIVALNPQLEYSWHKFFSSQSHVNNYDLNINTDGNIHIIGSTQLDMDLDLMNNGPELFASGYTKFWVSLSDTGDFQWVYSFATGNSHWYSQKTEIIDPLSGSCYIISNFSNGSIDLDRTSGTYMITGSSPNGYNDFIAKFDKDGHVEWGFVVDNNMVPRSLTVNKDNVKVGGGFRYTTDFNHGIRDSIVLNPNNPYETPFIASYDSQGQFLSVFTLSSSTNFNSRMEAVFNLPGSSTIIAIPSATGNAVLDIDPDTLSTVNIEILMSDGVGIASYSFPCIPATALSRDSFPTHYDYCANEWADLFLPTRASGYSQISWEADTGTGFFNMDTMQLDYHIVNDNLRVLTQNVLDTVFYRAVISNDCGSDTTETVSLYVMPSHLDTITYFLCKNDTVQINGTDYFYEAEFTDSVYNLRGCDSVTHFIIEDASVTSFITQVGNALVTSSGMDSVQWIRCAGNQIIAGENDTIFYPADTGNYAVIVYKNGCSDTSSCMRSSIGLKEFENQILVYPNPTSGKTYIQHSFGMPLKCKVRNALGQLVDEFDLNSSITAFSINTSGMMFLELYNDKGILLDTKKFLVLPY